MTDYDSIPPTGVIAVGPDHSIVPDGHEAVVQAEAVGSTQDEWVPLSALADGTSIEATGIYRVRCACGWRGQHWDVAAFNRDSGRAHTAVFWPVWAPVFVRDWEEHVAPLLAPDDSSRAALTAASGAVNRALADYQEAVRHARTQGVPWHTIASETGYPVTTARRYSATPELN